MAASVSAWTTMASNTQHGPGLSVTENVNVAQTATGASGINAHVRNECLVWLDGTADIHTKHFDFPVIGDLTIILNGTLNDISADAGDITVDMQGSLDGVNYVTMDTLITGTDWNAGGGGQAEVVGSAIYDYDSNGRMPFMRLKLDCSADAHAGTPGVADNIKVSVIKHTT